MLRYGVYICYFIRLYDIEYEIFAIFFDYSIIIVEHFIWHMGYLWSNYLCQCGHRQAKGERYLRHCRTSGRRAANANEYQQKCAHQFAEQHAPDFLVLRDVGNANEFRHVCKDKHTHRERYKHIRSVLILIMH